MTRQTITGYDAIEIARETGLSIAKHADPMEGARAGLSLEEAEEIASEDPSLVYVEATGILRDADTNDEIGEATAEQVLASLDAEAGLIRIDDDGDVVYPGMSERYGSRRVWVELTDV